MLHGIWLVIENGQHILPTNIFKKFDDYTMKTIQVIERTNVLDAARVPICPVFFKWAYKKGKTKTKTHTFFRPYINKCLNRSVVSSSDRPLLTIDRSTGVVPLDKRCESSLSSSSRQSALGIILIPERR